MIKPRREIQLGKWTVKIPGSPFARQALGIALVIGGILGFLPVLGFWMIPLGLLVLSIDLPFLRKHRRKWEVKREKEKRQKSRGLDGVEDGVSEPLGD